MGAGAESDGRQWPSRSRERLGWCWGGRDRDNAARGSAVWKEEGLVCGRGVHRGRCSFVGLVLKVEEMHVGSTSWRHEAPEWSV